MKPIDRRGFVNTGAAGALALLLPTLGHGQTSPVASVDTSPDTSPVRIADVYEVGAGVYVRALAVEVGRGSRAGNSVHDTLWVGTSAGVHEVDIASGRLRNTFTRRDGLANEYVFAIGLDRDGSKWFGTNAGGVSRYREHGPVAARWKTYFPLHGLADYWVYCFAQQRNGDLWIGTWAGANRVDARTGRFDTYVKELVNEWVYGLAVDAQDRVWFGTEGGVSMFDGRRWTAWTHADGLGAPNTEGLPFSAKTGLGTRSRHDLAVGAEGRGTYNPNYVFSILSARDGSVWAGTWGGGVARWDGTRWTNLTRADGLAGNIVYAIAQDAAGVLWFGTDQGVSRWDGSRWQTLGVADGLPERNVYALAVGPEGTVWAGTRGGVARIAR